MLNRLLLCGLLAVSNGAYAVSEEEATMLLINAFKNLVTCQYIIEVNNAERALGTQKDTKVRTAVNHLLIAATSITTQVPSATFGNARQFLAQGVSTADVIKEIIRELRGMQEKIKNSDEIASLIQKTEDLKLE